MCRGFGVLPPPCSKLPEMYKTHVTTDGFATSQL
jgi:hypothetical protein